MSVPKSRMVLQSAVLHAAQQHSADVAQAFAAVVVPALATAGFATVPLPERGKNLLDLAFRDTLFTLAKDDVSSANIDVVSRVLDLALHAFAQGYLNDIVLQLLQELLDCVTVTGCELLFSYMDSRSAVLTQSIVPNKGRGLVLLRLTNELLRRLSKTKHSVFAGQIRMFLARAFPLCEPSGVNLNGAFNTDNLTVIDPPDESEGDAALSTSKEDKSNGTSSQTGDSMDVTPALPATTNVQAVPPHPVPDNNAAPQKEAAGETKLEAGEAKPPEQSYDFYRQLWHLQEWLANPRASLDSTGWAATMTNIDQVLTAFETLPLVKQIQTSRKSAKAQQANNGISAVEQAKLPSMFLPKFLSSRKLLHLQLQDYQFLRHVLVQLLVAAHFWELYTASQRTAMTSAPNKAVVQPNIVLNEKQVQQLDRMRRRSLHLLVKLPPDGKVFTEMILSLLNREDNWIQWKKNSCPSFEKPSADKVMFAPAKRTRISVGGVGKLNLGNPELTRLFNIAPNTEEFLATTDNHPVPTLESYLERLRMELDPANSIEKAFLSSANPVWAWRCVRLISRSLLDKMQALAQMDGEGGVKLPNLEQFLKSLDAAANTTPSTTPGGSGVSVGQKRKNPETETEANAIVTGSATDGQADNGVGPTSEAPMQQSVVKTP